jgi:protein gp37
MADKTGIEWTDATWNPLAGCSIVSPACTNCYAMAQAARIERMQPTGHYAGLTQPSKAGPVWTGKIAHAPDYALHMPLRWKKPRRIFVNSMSDLFHQAVEDWKIVEIYGLMIAAHHLRGHTFQWLTKRPARARKLLNDGGFWDEVNDVAGQEVLDRCDPLNRRQGDARATCDDYSAENPPPGIWAGGTVEDQPRADERIPDILAIPAAKRFISVEPQLGEIDLAAIHPAENAFLDFRDTPTYRMRVNALSGWWWQEFLEDGQWTEFEDTGRGFAQKPYVHTRLDWVIAGGESGPHARPMHPDWPRALRDQCAAAGVPFFFKQHGEWLWTGDDNGEIPFARPKLFEFSNGASLYRVGKRRAGSLLDGVQHKEFPA